MMSLHPVARILEGIPLYPATGADVWRIRLGGCDVFLLAEGFNTRVAADKGFLVGFSGAIANVTETEPPYFAGRNLARTLDVPLLSFSDPTMERDPALTLGFHAGNNHVPDLPEQMAQVINRFTAATGKDAILFGGSGGGFAAMNTLAHCSLRDSAVVWNPQTAISRYSWNTFQRFAKAAFPGIAARFDLGDPACGPDLDAAIREAGCVTQISHTAKHGPLFYFQSITDQHHMTRHMAPFCNGSTLRRVHANGFHLPERNVHLCIGNWAQGHAPLARDLLVHTVRGMLVGRPPLAVQKLVMEKMAPDRQSPDIAIASEIDKAVLKIAATRKGAQINVTTTMPAESTTGLEYAFYLKSGAERIAHRWYKPDPHWQITAPSHNALTVQVFVRDIFGQKKSFAVPVTP